MLDARERLPRRPDGLGQERRRPAARARLGARSSSTATPRSSAAPASTSPTSSRSEGEAGFRQREAEVIDELTGRAGRGARDRRRRRARRRQSRAPARPRSRRVSSDVVEQQLARTRHSEDRPLLNNDDPRGTLERLMERAGAALRRGRRDHRDTDGRKVKTVVDQILRAAAGAAGGLTAACRRVRIDARSAQLPDPDRRRLLDRRGACSTRTSRRATCSS